MNKTVVILVGVAALLLIIFLFIRNQKDKRNLTDQLNRDYKKTKDEEGDIEIEDERKL